MEKKKERIPKQKNTAIDSFKHSRESGVMRNRFFAAAVDFIIIGFLYQFAVVVLGAPDIMEYLDMQEVVQGLTKGAPEVIERMRLWQACYITYLSIGAGYEALLLTLFGGSLGKLIFGFKVVSNKEDRNMLLCKLLLIVRSVVKALSIYLLSAIPFIILCLSVFSNEQARSGFDYFAGTRVINRRKGAK